MWKSLTLLVGFAAICSAQAAPDPNPPASNPPASNQPVSIDALLTQLASDHWPTRQSAQEKLVALGEPSLPDLEKFARQSTDNEVKARLASAITQIQDNRLIGMSYLSLQLKDSSASEALAQIAAQANAPMIFEPANLLSQKTLKLVSLSVDHRPFWEVMQNVCAQTGLEPTTVVRHNQPVGLGLTHAGSDDSSDWSDKPIVLSGPLLIRANRLVRVSTIPTKAPRTPIQEFTISLTAFAEPKLKVLDYSTSVTLNQVTDELGHSLIPPDEDGQQSNADAFGNSHEGYTSNWELGATLHYPKGTGHTIKTFKGTTSLVVQLHSAILDTPIASAKNSTHVIGAVRVLVKNVDNNRCDLCVYRDGRSDADWMALRLQLAAGDMQLRDDKNQTLARSPSGAEPEESNDNQRLEFRMRFNREPADEGGSTKRKSAAEATRLVWEFPTQVREMVIPFEFTDLPIP